MSCISGGIPMGFYRPEWGGDGTTGSLKRKFRWFFSIENITGDTTSALPCIRASRPKIQFREMQAEHLNETIYFPSKPDWQPIQLVLYDRCISSLNPIFSWLKQQYDPNSQIAPPPSPPSPPPAPIGCGAWYPCLDALSFKTCGNLKLFDGCGNVVEEWVLDHIYPQNIDWGELDMGNDDVVTVEFSLRYDRAYQTAAVQGIASDHILYGETLCGPCACIPSDQSPVGPCLCPLPPQPAQAPPQQTPPPPPFPPTSPPVPSPGPSPPSPGLSFLEVPDFVMF